MEKATISCCFALHGLGRERNFKSKETNIACILFLTYIYSTLWTGLRSCAQAVNIKLGNKFEKKECLHCTHFTRFYQECCWKAAKKRESNDVHNCHWSHKPSRINVEKILQSLKKWNSCLNIVSTLSDLSSHSSGHIDALHIFLMLVVNDLLLTIVTWIKYWKLLSFP